MRTVIVGMGALGLLYAKQIADSLGQEAVAFAMDEDRLEKYRGTVFEINGEKRSFSMESCKTAAPADDTGVASAPQTADTVMISAAALAVSAAAVVVAKKRGCRNIEK